MSEINTDNAKGKCTLKLKPAVIIPISICLTIIILMTITIFVSTAGDNIRNGVSVYGVDVSKMSKKQAVDEINDKITNLPLTSKVVIDYDGDKQEVAFSDFVNGYKVEEAVESAYNMARGKNIFSNAISSISLNFKKANLPLEPKLDEEVITGFIDSYALELDKPLEENIYKLSGDELKLINGKKGFSIDKEKAIEDIKNVIMSNKNGEVFVTKIEKEPVPFDVDKIYEDVCKPPVDAKYEVREGKGYLVKAKNGHDVDKNELQDLINSNKDNLKPYYISLKVVQPTVMSIDTDDLFEEEFVSFTSKISDNNKNRLTNVRIATEKIDGVILNPDEIFSYLKYVEPITVAGGYKVANVYNNGKIEQDIGGGVCQVSSALYSAVLYSNLDVVKRYNHSLTVGYVPLGQDATVASGEIDFRFRNSTNSPIKIDAKFDNKGVYIKILGKKPDSSLKIELENITVKTNEFQTVVTDDPALAAGEIETDTNGKNGYVVETYKNIYRDGKFVERVFVSKSVYKTVNKVQRRGVGTAAVSANVATNNGKITPSPSQTTITPTPAPAANTSSPIITPAASDRVAILPDAEVSDIE